MRSSKSLRSVRRFRRLGAPQAVLTIVLGVVALVVAVTAPPAFGVALAGVAIGAVWLGAIGLSLSFDRLIDPLTPSIGAAATFMTASIGSFVTVTRREARIRNRFAQHLAPEVVRRIAENPDMLKLRAEKREVTALFTDIEGFTAMTHRAGPGAACCRTRWLHRRRRHHHHGSRRHGRQNCR